MLTVEGTARGTAAQNMPGGSRAAASEVQMAAEIFIEDLK